MSTATAKAVQALHFELPPLPYPEDALAPVIWPRRSRFTTASIIASTSTP